MIKNLCQVNKRYVEISILFLTLFLAGHAVQQTPFQQFSGR